MEVVTRDEIKVVISSITWSIKGGGSKTFFSHFWELLRTNLKK